MLRSPSQDDREAHLFLDLASAVDAGMTVAEILDGPACASLPGAARTGSTLAEGLADKGLPLEAHELLMIETAEQAGAVSATLRRLAEQRRVRAERTRELLRRMAYPAFVMSVFLCVLYLTQFVINRSMTLPLAVTGALVAGAALVYLSIRQTVANPDRGLFPPLRRLVLDRGEVPYLRSLHGLYSAGVKIDEAHELAARTSPVRGIRERLAEVGRAVRKGFPLTDALHVADVLHPETRQMLAAAERAGDLEAALDRAATRREQAVDLATRRLIIGVSAGLYALVCGCVGWLAISFYSGLASFTLR